MAFGVVFIATLWVAVPVAFSATGINSSINFQGKLTDKNGLNVADTNYSVVFTLYDATTGGTTLWTETHTVPTKDGIFQVSLNSINSNWNLVNFNTDNLYLGIKVGADAEMTPRIRFTAVPYAMNAQKVAGLTVTNTTGTLTVPNGKTISFGDAFTTSGANPLTLTTTGTTNATLPAGLSVTLVDLSAVQVLTNKSIGSTGLTFSTASTDITTGTNEDLTIAPNGSGKTIISSGLTVNNLGTGNILSAFVSGATKFVVKDTGVLGLDSTMYGSCGALTTDALGEIACGSGETPGNGADMVQGKTTLTPTTLGATNTLIGTVSVTPPTVSGDIWIQAQIWTNSLNSANQTLTWRLYEGSACSGTLLDTQTSALTSASGANGPAGFLSYTQTNPGIVSKTYAICGSSSTANGASAGGIATATVIDTAAAIPGSSDYLQLKDGAYSFTNSTQDFVFGADATSSAVLRMSKDGDSPVLSIAGLTSGSSLTVDNAGTGNLVAVSKSGSNKFVVTNTGDVGVGTILPTAKLDVAGTASLSGSLTFRDNATNEIQTTNRRVLTLGGSTTGDIVFKPGGIQTLYLAGNGRVSLSDVYYANCGMLTTVGNVVTCATAPAGGSGVNYWRNAPTGGEGTFSYMNDTMDFLFGGVSTASAKFKLSPSGTMPTAQVSSTSSFAGLAVNQSGTGDIFTASSSGTTRLSITNTGGLKLGTNVGTAGQCLQSGGVGGSAVWGSCGSGGSAIPTVKSNSYHNATGIGLTTTEQSIVSIAITPSSALSEVLVIGTLNTDSGSTQDRIVTLRLRRTACTTGNQIGGDMVSFTTNATEFEAIAQTGVDTPGVTTPVTYHVCAVSNGTAVNAISAGVSLMEVNVGADLAEIYNTNDLSLGQGDVVALDSQLYSGIKKADSTSHVIGVVSSRPALLIGGGDRSGKNALPVALSGRVPVKVSTQNGAIKAGDYLTASTIPGVAVKASQSGAVIGIAMSDFDGASIGKVMMFVQNEYVGGKEIDAFNTLMTQDIGKAVDTVLSGVILDNLDGLEILRVSMKKTDERLDVLESLFATSSAKSGSESKDLSATGSAMKQIQHLVQLKETLSVLSLSVENNATVSGNLRVQGNGLIEGILNVVDMLTANNLIVNRVADFFGDAIFRGDVVFRGTPIFNNDTVGTAVIPKDQNRVAVSFERPFVEPPVVSANIVLGEVTKSPDQSNQQRDEAQDKRDQQVLENELEYLITRRTQNGFIIILNKPAPEDITFSWTALRTENNGYVTNPEPTAVPTILPTKQEDRLEPTKPLHYSAGQEGGDDHGIN